MNASTGGRTSTSTSAASTAYAARQPTCAIRYCASGAKTMPPAEMPAVDDAERLPAPADEPARHRGVVGQRADAGRAERDRPREAAGRAPASDRTCDSRKKPSAMTQRAERLDRPRAVAVDEPSDDQAVARRRELRERVAERDRRAPAELGRERRQEDAPGVEHQADVDRVADERGDDDPPAVEDAPARRHAAASACSRTPSPCQGFGAPPGDAMFTSRSPRGVLDLTLRRGARKAGPRCIGPRDAAVREVCMARFRSNKRAKELQRKAKHEAKEARKKERQERRRPARRTTTSTGARRSASIPPPGWKPPGEDDGETEDDVDVDDDGRRGAEQVGLS